MQNRIEYRSFRSRERGGGAQEFRLKSLVRHTMIVMVVSVALQYAVSAERCPRLLESGYGCQKQSNYSQGVTMTNTTHFVELIIKNNLFWLLVIAQTTKTNHFYEKRGHFFVRQFVERLHVKWVTLPKLEPPCHQNLLVQLLECRAADL